MPFKKIGNNKNIDVKKYFLYRHIRLDTNMPFYIGIGLNNRKTVRTRYYERAYEKTNRTKWWKNISKKTEYEVDIILETDNREEIISKEIEFIELYGRADLGKGTLVNLTNGGDGINEATKELRMAISARMMGNKHSYRGGPKVKPKIYIKGDPLPESHRIALRGTHPNSKKLICEENGIVYSSIGQCIRDLFNCNLLAKENGYRKIKHGISKVCNGKLSNYKNYKFKFL